MAKENYEVGYRKPPKASRFKRGRSGNPKGRPKGSLNVKTDLNEVLSQKVTIQERGRVKKVSKQKAIILAQIAKAMKGDHRSANLVMTWQQIYLPEDETEATEALSPAEQAILNDFLGISERPVPRHRVRPRPAPPPRDT